MKYIILIILSLSLINCGKSGSGSNTSPTASPTPTNCGNDDTYKVINGSLVHNHGVWNSNLGLCIQQVVPLTPFESSSFTRQQAKSTCVPQKPLGRITLQATGNFYTYRDNKMFLELNWTTGEFRRLVLGEHANDSTTVFTRDQGCFYERLDTQTEAVNPTNYGDQIMLDMQTAASSNINWLNEFFKWSGNTNDWSLVRSEDTSDADWTYCPYKAVPWGFCDLMRDGNVMILPTLTGVQEASLSNDSALIRMQYNYVKMNNSDFDTLWNTTISTVQEVQSIDMLYATNIFPNTYRYSADAWRDYMMGKRPQMPDLSSPQDALQCFDGFKNITMADGSTGRVKGQICSVNGIFNWMPIN